MFICSCNALSDRDIKSVAKESKGDVVACYRLLGARPDCGSCLDNAQKLIDKTLAEDKTTRARLRDRDEVGES